jgi:hypothetical protein
MLSFISGIIATLVAQKLYDIYKIRRRHYLAWRYVPEQYRIK